MKVTIICHLATFLFICSHSLNILVLHHLIPFVSLQQYEKCITAVESNLINLTINGRVYIKVMHSKTLTKNYVIV